MSDKITFQTELSANIVAFCRFLRAGGLTTGPADQADVLQALTLLEFGTRASFREVLRAMIPKDYPEQQRFDELFEEYWSKLGIARNSKLKTADEPEASKPGKPPERQQPSFTTLQNWLTGKRAEEKEELSSYSPGEAITRKDFSAFRDEEVAEIARILNLIARTLARRVTRRYQKSKRSRQFDMRRTMRANMRRGGEIVELAYRRKRIRKMKLVMLCDVSKSMDLYSRFLIQFIFGFQTVYHKIETFVFSTSLQRVTDALRGKSLDNCLDSLSTAVPNWSGGTRIGASLGEFLEDYGRKLDDRTIVLILSDGWDTGEIELLESSMAEIQRRAARVIWLNPLAGSEEFEPTVRGMQAALPYVDVFAPAHNIESLKRFALHLRRGSYLPILGGVSPR